MGFAWKILVGDCLERFAEVETGSVALVLTSPPYNIGKPYEQAMPLDGYLLWCRLWLAEIRRVLTPTGAAWINLGFVEVADRGKAVPLPYLLWPLIDLYIVQEVVWRCENGVACRRRLSPRNEKLLWFVRDPASSRFNLDAVRDPNIRYPNSRKNGRLRNNPAARTPAMSGTSPRS